jgi:Transposase DDE domain group 1
MFSSGRITYEMADKAQAMSPGGIGAIHLMNTRLGLPAEIDKRLELLKFHVPYHESDHVLNLSYNVLCGGVRLEDIELRRNDEVFLNGLGAQRIPDPTTAGDFTRRFETEDICGLMEACNAVRTKIWRRAENRSLLEEALLDMDGTIQGTCGECKGGMKLSYKGVWGYAPLIVSLANTKEVLYLVNRPGNVASHEGAAEWINKAIALVKPYAQRICLRGDTDFSLTAHFDSWAKEVDFVFGMDAHPTLVGLAEALPESAWKALPHQAGPEIKTQPRQKPENVKEAEVKEKEYRNLRLKSQEVAEFEYQPGKCERSYRMVVVRKNISVEKGEKVLLDDVRYFFYITTKIPQEMTAEEVVEFVHGRCDQENVIEQLKNGVNAMRMPVDDLLSNWAYMAITAQAWNMKSWYGLLMPRRARGLEIVKMEFRRFLHTIILLPAQVVRSGRRVIYRILAYNDWVGDFFSCWERLTKLNPT